MPTNYDSIANYYDRLSFLVFGRSLIEAQTCLLSYIPAGSKILIIGGGTGLILEEIAKMHESGLMISYVDSSAKMITKAKARDFKKNQVAFIHEPVEGFCSPEKFDIVFTAFLFDNFRQATAEQNFCKIDLMLKSEGQWLFVDFFDLAPEITLSKKWLLKIMYFFFRFSCNIEAKELVDMQPVFTNNSYHKIFELSRNNEFIKSIVYSKGTVTAR